MAAIGDGKVVCVTGAAGYVASWIVKLLLERGYTVRATVRNPADPKKTEHLLALAGAKERLHLFKANLLEPGSFDAVVEGCDVVFHTASPFTNEVSDPQAELIDPAVNGTLNVLTSCKKCSIRRVILTSSLAAVVFNARPRGPDVVIDETWFSDAEVAKQAADWYVLSKTLAEEAAWKFAKENALDLVTINPGMVEGPLLQPSLNTSAALILMLISGSPTYPNLTFGWVDVRDVALAHVLAYEDPSSSGRYILSESVAHFADIVKILHDLYPSIKLPDRYEGDGPPAPTGQISTEKAKSLGVNFIPLKTSLKDTVESLKQKGFAKL